ncbi:MAG: ATP-dependent RNA helicase SrmB [Idiomarina sp.]|nr:ATP-dependent RNA helicase SrmB [Idiomarina sp.]
MTPDWQQLELSPELINVVLDQQLMKPTQIQQQVIPAAMEGHDILASSPTGTGKTLAFLLPIFQYLLDYPRRKPGSARVLILAPTRELAEQIGRLAEVLAKATETHSLTVTGGVNYGSHLGAFEKNLDVLIATPGRLLDYLSAEQMSAEDLEILVLDECDRLLDMGFRKAVEQIQEEAPHLRQRMMFSATMDHVAFRAFSQQALNSPVIIEADPPKRERGKIHQWVHVADDLAHKQALLIHCLKTVSGRVLVFVRKRERVHALAEELGPLGFPVVALEGELPQSERQSRLKQFADLRARVLVATDVAARGLDVADVELVINFDLPRKGDSYVHRIGRTGRAGKKGTAISLVEAHDAECLGRIERYLDTRIERRMVDSLRPSFKFPDPHVKGKSKAKKKKKKKAAGAATSKAKRPKTSGARTKAPKAP